MNSQGADLRGLRVRENQRYVSSNRSDSLRTRIEEFWEHAQDCLAGGGSRRRLFAVIGESGSGKTTSINHVLNSFEAFKPYRNEFNELMMPFIGLEVDRACTTKDLAIHIFQQLGLPANRASNEDDLYSTLKKQLRLRGTILLHLDEAQHLMKSNSEAAVRGLQDRFKSLLSIPEWPLHMIVSGVPELATLFTGDQQLANRSLVMRFEKYGFPADQVAIVKILSDIASDHCGLKLAPELLTDDFLGRFVRATDGGVGTMIEMIRAASYKALSKSHKHLGPKDFEFVYGRVSGSLVAENIMTAESWVNLERKNALIDLVPAAKRVRSKKVEK
ncbi:ATP-binding protein [Ensifer adhaerens]|uniref:ATP-binding protein n=1 Tax=Ensifer adhaerens TaxID=106592 RepID=UPI001CBD13D8|nr:ATP-binding protein [Ensifer adhaerens]MBZ7927023.1 ATP-binding protein [Ensifer adhaerens]UAX96674.1 ATP-binding protein [Ensifer adhaerens]UAY03982.1 ATP-binding protein [Ensifer adhaerens]UAY11968.1 ATP-binding protein [Ensifer adhaerens]